MILGSWELIGVDHKIGRKKMTIGSLSPGLPGERVRGVRVRGQIAWFPSVLAPHPTPSISVSPSRSNLHYVNRVDLQRDKTSFDPYW